MTSMCLDLIEAMGCLRSLMCLDIVDSCYVLGCYEDVVHVHKDVDVAPFELSYV